jgi:hypothetical protein
MCATQRAAPSPLSIGSCWASIRLPPQPRLPIAASPRSPASKSGISQTKKFASNFLRRKLAPFEAVPGRRPPLSQAPKHANSPPERVETFQAHLRNYSLPPALRQHHYLPPLLAERRSTGAPGFSGQDVKMITELLPVYSAEGTCVGKAAKS